MIVFYLFLNVRGSMVIGEKKQNLSQVKSEKIQKLKLYINSNVLSSSAVAARDLWGS